MCQVERRPVEPGVLDPWVLEVPEGYSEGTSPTKEPIELPVNLCQAVADLDREDETGQGADSTQAAESTHDRGERRAMSDSMRTATTPYDRQAPAIDPTGSSRHLASWGRTGRCAG